MTKEENNRLLNEIARKWAKSMASCDLTIVGMYCAMPYVMLYSGIMGAAIGAYEGCKHQLNQIKKLEEFAKEAD